jgi:hypothetical protein
MKRLIRVLTLVFSLSAAACATPSQPPVATPLPLVPSATAAVAAPSAEANVTPPAATAVPTVVTTAAPASPTARATAAIASTSTANPAVAGGLVGLWQGNNNSFYLLNKDGTWNWDQKLQQVLIAPENQGRWWLEGDIFRIQDVSGKAPCPPDQIGSYQAQLSGDTLVFTALADLCRPRIDQTAGQYARQPAGP